MLLEKTMEEIRTDLSQYITSEEENNHTIIAENTPQDLGMFRNSDLIFIFLASGDMVVFTERVKRKDLSFLEWMIVVSKVNKAVMEYKNTDGVMCSFSQNKEFIDINYYKEEWYQCIEKLL